MAGIESYAVYLPVPRLDRADVARVIGGRGKGERPVASYDEDATTMGVEAARAALRGTGGADSLWFATTRPAYLEKSNAATVAAASGLPAEIAAYDVSGALRGGAGALRAGLSAGTSVVVASDVRYGLPGSADEADGADAAAALVVGPDPVAELVGTASLTSEFLDRWRIPGDVRTRTWEERFGVEEYVPLVERVVDDVLGRCELKREQVDHVVISTPHSRARATARRGFEAAQLAAVDTAGLGYAGAADLAVGLALALDAASPGDLVLAVSATDGADAFVFRVTEKHATGRRSGLADAAPGQPVSYGDFLNWRGLLPREPARRPDVKPPVPPASRRTAAWKFGFVAAQCGSCGYRNLPPRRVCLRCSATEGFEPVSMVDVPGRIATFTDDWLSESVQLPARVVAVDFDGGGRFECEMTDAVGREIAIGDRVTPAFRLASVAGNGVRNYVWKVRPHLEEED
ncbi:hydroxymethylglutaryl-CoA synthase family protein [Nocardioides humi]|uniref:3-oxoacyl-[acyl-carrier-protein] synthase III C-terminal domain-containing protein n=1 Tax=Nocardioides humi TaxID=449461 RepID=A0ABN2BSE9_9ACTN|nr:hydroxymethylglutaryl-CoA synthase family protein [Nocardioides humi]